MNQDWHEANVMPRNPTREQKVKWHADHEDDCGCRPVPVGLRAEVRALKKRDERTN